MLQPYWEGFRFTVRADHGVLEWILNLTDSTGKVARWALRLSGLKFDVFHLAGIKHQEPYAILGLRTTGTDQTAIGYVIPVLRITHSDNSLKEEPTASYMQDNDVNDDRTGMGLPAVYIIATYTECNYKKQQITPYKFVQDQVKYSYSRHASCPVGLRDLPLKY